MLEYVARYACLANVLAADEPGSALGACASVVRCVECLVAE
jgi:hypothetical protein